MSQPVSIGQPGQGWLKRTLPLLGPHRKRLVAVVTASVISILAIALTPVIVRHAVDEALIGGEPVGFWIAIIAAAALLRFLTAFVTRYNAGRVSLNLEFDLRTLLFEHLQRMDVATHDEIQTGQLTSRANSDVRMLQMFLAWTPILMTSLLMSIVAIGVMVAWHWLLALVAIIPLPLVLVIATRMRGKLFPASWDSQQRQADMAEVIDEAITGVRVVRAFGQEHRELERFTDRAVRYFRSQMRVVRLSAKYSPAMMMVPNLSMVLVLLVGAPLVRNDRLTEGQFLGFLTYVVMMVTPIQMLGFFVAVAQRARASAERILEILDSEPTIFDAPGAVALNVGAGEVELRDVHFGYVASAPVLKGLNLKVAGGERVAIVGGNRSGKSTLTTLLPRFYAPTSGTITIDGQNISEVTLKSLRRQVGIVFEESFLFSGTIRDNIAYAHPGATDEEVVAAATAAGAHEFIASFPDGYSTEVGESGMSVSGGQRQRIALARALLGNPKVLVLDDATSSVDVQTEQEILDALSTLLEGRTTILVASRPSTVALADRVVLIDNGRAVESGTHDELIERSQLYRELMGQSSGDAAHESIAKRLMMGAMSPGGDPEESVPRGITKQQQIDALAGRGGRAAWVAAMPATPELLAKVEALPQAPDEPEVDPREATAPVGGFSPWRLLRPYRWPIALGLALIVARTLLQLAGPTLVRWGVDGTMLPQVAAGVFLATVLANWGIMWRAIIWTLRIGERALLKLRIQVFSHLQRMSIDYFDREMSGRVMSRMTSDIDTFGLLIQEAIFNILISFLTLFGAVVALFLNEPRLAVVVAVGVVPALLLFTQWFRKASDRAYLKVRDRIAAVLAGLHEGIAGVRVSQAFVREREESEEFRRLSSDLLEARKEGILYSSIFFPGTDAIGVASQAAVIGAAALLLPPGRATAAIVVAFVLYLNQFFGPIQQLSQLFDTYQQAKAGGTKLNELLSRPSATPAPEQPTVPAESKGRMVFRDVHFGYFDRSEVLHGVDLEIEPGEKVALVGKTGAGKSTLIKLAARFYDPTGGSILLDSVDLRQADPSWLRRVIGVVPQEPFLFSGTIRDNIVYGRPDSSHEEVESASELVGAHDIFKSAQAGYDTPVLGRGRGLSAGEKQLIALARVALADPRVLLLDEPTSRLDLYTESQILKALDRLLAGRTCLVIAHRLSTVINSDRIVVMDKGRIVEVGSHAELLRMGGMYADLHARWLGPGVLTATSG